MKKIFISLTIVLIVLIGIFIWFLNACEDDWCFYFQWQKIRATNSFEECVARGFGVMESYPRQCRLPNGSSFVEQIQVQAIESIIEDVSLDQKIIHVRDVQGDVLNVSLAPDGRIFTKQDREVSLEYLHRSFRVRLEGSVSASQNFLAQKIIILEEPNIIVFLPQANEEAGLPVIIKGEARVFESTVNYRIQESDEKVLLEGFTMAESPDVGEYGAFEIFANYPEPEGAQGTIEVFTYSAKDGAEIDKVVIPIQFKKVDSLIVKVFFGSNTLNPKAIDCTKVFGVDRRIPKTQGVARAALEELFKGPTPDEIKNEYFTSINPGVKVQNVVIEDKTAKADFNETLDFLVGGSCRVTAIASQIEETLKQFPNIKNVVISINGRTEDILQP